MAALINFGDFTGDEKYISCTVEGCGEAILLSEIASHVEMHEEEGANVDDEPDDDDDGSSRSSKKRKLEHETKADFDTTLPPNALRNLDNGKVEAESAHEQVSSKRAAFNKLFNIGGSPKTSNAPIPIKSSRRRLGVSSIPRSSIPVSLGLLLARNRNWDHMPMRKRCLCGLSSFSKKAMVLPRLPLDVMVRANLRKFGSVRI